MNIIFIPNINLGNNRNTPYHYSIKSWKKWAEQYNNVKVIEWDEPIMDPNEFKITLQRYWVHDILKHNKVKYEQVLVVDADTIIHPDCPNFFEIVSNKSLGVVLNNGCYEWVTRSIEQWGKAGTDQTIINYLVQQNNLDTVYIPEAYNLQDLFRKNLLHIPGHSWFPDELRFLEAGWIYHFNAIPQNDRHVDYWMERTYKELYT